ncbi:MAG: radical SAM protein [Promethearchaeota archaeon]
MDPDNGVVRKLEVLGASAAYDASCSQQSLDPSEHSSHGVYPSVTGGRVIPQFKVLLSNACKLGCKYCFTQCSKHRRVATFTPEEYASTFMRMYLQKRVDSLFISSAVVGDPDSTTRKMIEAVRLVREKYRYGGYVHFKCLPGTNRDLISEASQLADRMSVNLEAPTPAHLSEVAPDKDFHQDLLLRQEWIADLERKGRLPAGQTTQFVVGVAGESDWDLLKRVHDLHRRLRIRRAYFSPFRPLPGSPLEDMDATPTQRTKRLYKADFLLRRYGFDIDEVRAVLDDEGNLPPGDPKVHLARSYFDPGEAVEVNEAPWEVLVRVPGIGTGTASKILQLREKNQIIRKALDLKRLGASINKAMPFLKICGQAQTSIDQFLVAA